MNHHYAEVAVVGGGASGMIAALTAAEVPGRHVVLLERQQRIGRKLLATGNGRCNLTNRDAGPDDYFGTDPSFAAYALSHFRSVDTQRFFAHLAGSTPCPIPPTACWMFCASGWSALGLNCAAPSPWRKFRPTDADIPCAAVWSGCMRMR